MSLSRRIPYWRSLTWCLALAIIVLPVIAVLNGWIGSERWPISNVRIHAAPGQLPLERTDIAQLRQILTPFASKGYFAIDLAAAQQALHAAPWVETVRLRKYWPDILDIQISEQRPFARWGEDRVLTEQGQMFAAQGAALPDGLPHLDGPDEQALEVVRQYLYARALFTANGIELEHLGLDARGSWRFVLNSGTEVILGRSDTQRRLRRFARMLPGLLARHPASLERADLRYSNGFALVWTSHPPTPHRPAAHPSST